jgi:D-3-phosphoglycerate dehydrogenase
MNAKKWIILIIGDRFVRNELFEEAITRQLADLQIDVHYKFMENAWPDEKFCSIEEVHEAVGDVDAIIREAGDVDIIVTDLAPITRRVIESAPSLKLIGITRGGPVNVNLEAAEERGVAVVNTPGRNATAVAEFVLGMILAHVKKIAECHTDLKKGIWRGDCYRYDQAPWELGGQTAGLIGFGIIGRLVAPMLKCLGMEVIASDPYVADEVFEEQGVVKVDLITLLKQSDVVSLHARLTGETTGMIGRRELRMMKPSACIVNSARGPLMDYKALCRALKEGWIAGAVLDTFDVEPIDHTHPLLELDNVTLTPHIAGSSKETASKSCERMAQEIRRFINNEPLACQIRI